MGAIAGLPFDWAAFDKTGAMISALPAWSTDGSVSDVVVLAHGWKTDAQSAFEELYRPLSLELAKVWAAAPPAGRTFGVIGVLWPSKQFDPGHERSIDLDENVRGAGLSAGDGGAFEDIDEAALAALIADYAAFADIDGAALQQQAKAAVHGLRTSDCRKLLRTLLEPLYATASDPELVADRAPYEIADAQAVLQKLSLPPQMPVSAEVGAAAGVGAVVGRGLVGAKAAVARLLNQLTYYEMKARAGKAGVGAATHLLKPIAQANTRRVHLIGHSFGARLVTSAAHRAGAASKIRSLSMLQGAFSHNALSTKNGGAFAGAYRNVSGPTLITHTHNDGAVTLAYALASRLARDNTRAIGDRSDKFGAIGANGALGLPAGDVVDSVSTAPPALKPGRVHNIQCDACITGHMTVTNDRVAALVAAAIVA